MAFFWAFLAITFLMVIVFENDWLPVGTWKKTASSDFAATTAMQLITIASIPTGMYLFQIKSIKLSLRAIPERNLRKWGTLRILMFGLPMLINTLFYYMYMNVSFGYMAIICLLCFPFIYPSMARCQQETSPENNEQPEKDNNGQ